MTLSVKLYRSDRTSHGGKIFDTSVGFCGAAGTRKVSRVCAL